jgi:hypothetical protein
VSRSAISRDHLARGEDLLTPSADLIGRMVVFIAFAFHLLNDELFDSIKVEPIIAALRSAFHHSRCLRPPPDSRNPLDCSPTIF